MFEKKQFRTISYLKFFVYVSGGFFEEKKNKSQWKTKLLAPHMWAQITEHANYVFKTLKGIHAELLISVSV